MNILDRLKQEEGYRQHVYKDSLGKETYGYGFLLVDGLSEVEASAVLSIRVNKIILDLRSRFPWFNDLSIPRQDVLIDMTYNLGLHGLLQFHDMLESLSGGNYEQAAKDMIASKWYQQVGQRAINLAEMMRNG